MVNFLFYSSIIITIIGLALRVQAYNGGAFLMLVGFLGIGLYFVAKFFKDLVKKQNDWTSGLMHITLALMSLTLFSRYLYYTFWDYPGIVIVPLFLVFTIRYFFFKKLRDRKIISSSIFYILLTIPLFGWDFFKDPRDLIPQDWYDRYDASEGHLLTLPWDYDSKLAESISDSAWEQQKDGNFDEAINLYRQSLDVEFNQSTLFNMSLSLANSEQLEEAISLLDTLIQLSPSFSATYNNRGLIFYHMDEQKKAILDYKKAIKLEPNHPPYHSNLALAYYHNKQYNEACKEINEAIRLGSGLQEESHFASIIKYINCSISEQRNETPKPISRIQESTKHNWNTQPFPFVIQYDDTIGLTDPMYVKAVLNSEIFAGIAQHENLDLSYIISASNDNINLHRLGDFKVASADTMQFEIYFDSLNIDKDSSHLWQFIATASFERDGKFFYDTTIIYQKDIYIKVD